jgi:hypothetical protein
VVRNRESLERRQRMREQIQSQRQRGARRPWSEFLVPATLVVLIATGVFEYSRFQYVRSSVHRHFQAAARFATEVQSPSDPATGKQITRAESVTQYIATEVRSLPVTVETVVMDPADGGKPGDVVRIEARYRLVPSPLMRLLVSPSDQFFTESAVVTNQQSF